TTTQALCEMGVQARLWRPGGERVAEAACLHLFRSEPEHWPLVEAARRQNIPVVISTIAWFDLASRWREPRSLVQRSIACGKFLTRAALPRLPSWRRRLYHAADLLLPNSQVEAQQLTRYFGISPQKIHVVPNGADTRFAEARPQAFAQLAGERNFVLYAGRIEPRKNQF